MALVAETVAEAAPGFYLIESVHGFVVHMNASAEHLRLVRELIGKRLMAAGVGTGTAEAAQLVTSELSGNAVRAYGDLVPLVIEVDVTELGVWVKVHDPDPGRLPHRRSVRMDDAAAESGRGLPLVDAFAPGWDVAVTPVGKQVRARVPLEGRNRG
ncbi:ATP-binding protein [Streptomyces johnsoniae]|uniref:ATP-binding protein n=1 Tax=Streptomyces johnsoniae TaxID=3075532 RepID=A0ABU2S9F5_9ACTN|nr:ATP-binding protein [Streptomyces sp. DSM 41886]MDT0445613.1 ATP-binding protein [Streptomyces sp. DSM 41886]